MGEELNTRKRRDWSAMVGPLFPFLIVGVVLFVALCLLVSAVLVTTPPGATPTPGLPLAQARETATAQASATRYAQTQQATLPTRLPTLHSPSPLPTATPAP
ncbi:MAG: hypothetical protein M5R40_30100 [Anaerolineae bacterium]|nr:hypothetical protein [Anaerolineae bacterium]